MYKKKGISRRNIILSTAAELFYAKGYEETSVDEIIAKVEIAKGTFYYYFKTKEELLYETILFLIGSGIEKAMEIVKDPNLGLEKKWIYALAAVNQDHENKDTMLKELHRSENTRFHQEIGKEVIKQLEPVITEIIEEGIRKGVYKTPYPKECARMYLTITQVLLDDSAMKENEKQNDQMDEKNRRVNALLYVMQTSLQADPEAFLEVREYLFLDFGSLHGQARHKVHLSVW